VEVAPNRLERIHGIEPEAQTFVNDLAGEFRMARAYTSEPVTAVVGTRGKATLILTDGHHRRLAALRAKMRIPVRLDFRRSHLWQQYEMDAINFWTEGM
jgi:hypothetical protein